MPLFLCLVLLPGLGPGGFRWAGVRDCSSVGAVRRARPGCKAPLVPRREVSVCAADGTAGRVSAKLERHYCSCLVTLSAGWPHSL